MKGVLSSAGTIDFCSTLAALVGFMLTSFNVRCLWLRVLLAFNNLIETLGRVINNAHAKFIQHGNEGYDVAQLDVA